MVVQNHNSNFSFTSVASKWHKDLVDGTPLRLPIFYYTLDNPENLLLGVELVSPCQFHAIHNQIRNINIKNAFDELFDAGVRTQCSALAWDVTPAGENPPTFCVILSDPSRAYEVEALQILSILIEPFPNSTAEYTASDDLPPNTKEFESCMRLTGEANRRKDMLRLRHGIPLAQSIDKPAYIYQESYNFLTCDGAVEYLSFKAYGSPFQLSTWIGILITVLLLSFILQGFARFERIKEIQLLLVPSVLLEHPPAFSSQLLNLISFKCLLISLLFSGIVITNSYKSIVTTDLTRPFTSRRVESLNEAVMLGYKILPPVNVYMRSHEPNWPGTAYYLTLSFLTNSLMRQIKLINTLGNSSGNQNRREKLERILNLIGVPDDFPNSTFQMEIAKCNKTIYVDNAYPLDAFRVDLIAARTPASKLYKGKSSFMEELYTWSITSMEWDRSEMISLRFNALSQSGIMSHLDYVFRIGEMKSRVKRAEREFEIGESDVGKPLTLDSNLLSIFVVYVVLLAFCIFIFALENVVTFVSYSYSHILRLLRVLSTQSTMQLNQQRTSTWFAE